MFSNHRIMLAVALFAGLSLSACATAPSNQAELAEFRAMNDPLEPANRVIFDVNDFLDRLIAAPLAGLYRVTVPPPLRDRLANLLSNMSEPVILANNLMQGEFKRAEATLGRFAANTTLGVGGIFEVANGLGLQQQRGDFGQTLHVWGVSSGPYLVLPLFGPSNVRDTVGLIADTFMSPWKYVTGLSSNDIRNKYVYSDMGASALVRREAVMDSYSALREGSLDFYSQMRSVYRQHRAKQLGDTQPILPQFDDYEVDSSPLVH
jgi:phospholipid-binding lipoprotein MlaA